VSVTDTPPATQLPEESSEYAGLLRGTDAQDFDGLFRQHRDRVGRFLAQMVRSRGLAEDLLQDTFAAALKARDQLSGVQNIEAWLLGIARNQTLMALRTERRARSAMEKLHSLSRPREDDPEEATVIRDLLIDHLEHDDRALILLRYVHGLSAVDLAKLTERSPEAVRKQLERARNRILEVAADEGLLRQE
jgi:RNA polymerase sigma-70 factor, ECF subfamily